ncbi:Protein of unknown function [Streptomyces melanosporofaciens]|uniref:Uncharacterized protein n=1 Tax=Streptomyces melanosporofaciens TaxID=67327 RepID=A0A1H4XCP2_STRMJ|nr:Protein of unknown function [Streptomyces melanosporofaciens]
MSESGKAWDEGGPERLYTLSRGRAPHEPRQRPVELVSLIVARAEPEPGMAPETAAVLRMCPFPLSVAEISAYLLLPVSTVTVILAELLGMAGWRPGRRSRQQCCPTPNCCRR